MNLKEVEDSSMLCFGKKTRANVFQSHDSFNTVYVFCQVFRATCHAHYCLLLITPVVFCELFFPIC